MQMCWKAEFCGTGEKILHIRLNPFDPWKPYKAFPTLAVPDYKIPNGSKGFATMQTLLKKGFSIVNEHHITETKH